MAKFTKHVGQDHMGNKLAIVFREIPDDADNCLVVYSNSLPEMYHDQLMRVIDSDEAQQLVDLYEILTRRNFGDGNVMLNALHGKGLLRKLPVDKVTVVPMPNRTAPLREVNNQIRASKGQPQLKAKTDAELPTDLPAITVPPGEEVVLSSKEQAKAKLDEARQKEEDAQRLREEAYTLDPDLKKGGRPSKKATA
jgi:hypothetical protein